MISTGRSYFSSSGEALAKMSADQVIGALAARAGGVEGTQRFAWEAQFDMLLPIARQYPDAHFFWEFQIPRMGKRADIVIFQAGVVLVLEFKVGSTSYSSADRSQALDYAVDLKNFHSGSHDLDIVPILVSTQAPAITSDLQFYQDRVSTVLSSNVDNLADTVNLAFASSNEALITATVWEASPYRPTPTIIQAAQALYRDHSVENISRSDAGHKNLSITADYVKGVAGSSKKSGRKSICFVTGVPGSGKTLAGLNIATELMSLERDEQAVFLSGNGPLVDVLREALVRDDIARAKTDGQRLSKADASRKANAFIQNVHHFRDDSLSTSQAPANRVVIFDEAQRAWDMAQTASFMKLKKNVHGFELSEPAVLLSVMDRHEDWCSVVCLIGGGQEINRGEAGLGEWFSALQANHSDWDVHVSSSIGPDDYLSNIDNFTGISSGWFQSPALHLGTSLRSFRSENVSQFINQLLANDLQSAKNTFAALQRFPVVVTRDLGDAKKWVKSQKRGSERVGLLASSNAIRLRPEGVHVKVGIDPAAWLLNDSADVRSSDALEEPATEFDIQGLEIDWSVVCWDANLRYSDNGWEPWSFKGTRWQQISNEYRESYLLNAYRVLLSRARQGFVIYVPQGDEDDLTRSPSFYDPIYNALISVGVRPLESKTQPIREAAATPHSLDTGVEI